MFKEKLRIGLWNFKARMRQRNLFPPQLAALVLLFLGIVVVREGFHIQHPNTTLSLTTLASDFYANISSSLFEIALTVLIIDFLYRRRDDHLEKIRLIRDIGCGDNGIAIRAIMEITDKNLHWKGFLRNRHFLRANLAGAMLLSADLSYSSFHYTDFTGATLSGAKLFRASFWRGCLRGVDLRGADLTKTDFIYADLTEALVTRKQLQSVERLHGARLPNGKIYDGSFNCPGDLNDAQVIGVDIDDPAAMKNFYALPYDQFMRLPNQTTESPERTDWGLS